MNRDNNNTHTGQNEQFTSLLLKHQDELYSVIFSLIHNFSDADDLYQETVMVMCRKFDEYDTTQSFIAWGIGIAKNKILNFRSKQQREQQKLSDVTFHKLADHFTNHTDRHISDKADVLKKCIGKLNTTDQKLMAMRYQSNMGIKEIADIVKRTNQALHQAFYRIMKSLRQCIKSDFSSQEMSS